SGYTASGKNVAEKRNIGWIANVMNSKSFHDRMYVVAHIPTPAKAAPMRMQAGRASTAHHDRTNPIASATPKKIAEYTPPRISDHMISPIAMSQGRAGV